MSRIFLFFEAIIFYPKIYYLPYYIILLPFGLLYIFINIVVTLILKLKERDYNIKVISIGNLVLGGSGKTPLVTAIAKKYSNSAIVLRGYGRDSRGVVVVSTPKDGILCDVSISGDEAMLYALKCKDSYVIVSEDRAKGVSKAKELGASLVLLDDGYKKFNIKKLDIVISSDTKNILPFPAGAYRNILYPFSNIFKVKEDKDFSRIVNIVDGSDSMFCVSAISKPFRLQGFFDDRVIGFKFYKDHHNFSKEEIAKVYNDSGATTLLVTYKDYVKLKDYGTSLSIMDLDLKIDDSLYSKIGDYLKD